MTYGNKEPRRPDNAPVTPHRVLHLVSTFAPKTDTRWLLQIARHLDRRRFDLHAACFYEGGEIQRRLSDCGVATHNFAVASACDPRAITRAAKLIRQIGPDLVHTHLLRADLLGGIAARWAGVPVVLTTAYAVGDFRRAVRRASDPLLDAACRLLPTHVLAVSDAVRQDCLTRLGWPADRVRTIRTGIDPPDAVDPAEVARVRSEWCDAGERLVLTVARLSYEKGVDVLIDAAAAIADRAARFVVVGDGPQRDALQRRIDRLGLFGRVRLAGFRDDVWPCLAAADIVAMPSLMEGLPNALLEAMAIGRPIVATRVGGIPEAIESGVNGLLVEPGDATALADGVRTLLCDADLALRLGEAAAATVRERFLARDVVAQYASWYESLIDN
jgi:glycosyltransferase involved in cell wall biosynthesis